MGFWLFAIGDVELEEGHYDAAIDGMHKAIEGGYGNFLPYSDLAAGYALEGKMDEAKSALAEARRFNPSLTVKWAIAHSPDAPKWFEGLPKAGLPEE
jgi:tetratricopeptide (TPR) repeat protein